MSARLRLAAAVSALSVALVFSALGVFAASASAKARGRVVSAKLTPTTSFAAAQANTVKLVCKFSPASKRVVLLLSMKTNAKWVKVRSVTKRGSFKTYTTTVKKLFGSKAVTVGQYRVKISADANVVTRSFKVVTGRGTDDGNNPPRPGGMKPEAGYWESDDVYFYVAPDQASVLEFDFWYSADSEDCDVVEDEITMSEPQPIANNSFSHAGSFAFSGTFDSETSAHGTAEVTGSDPDCGYFDTGEVEWTATWESDDQP
jgi:hypothetical protein